ncbi:AlpA family transcriptional regulator [Nocardioides albertanoniae]|uniref:AlpA family transcriptional regulator n=2 Tax=Nocardioides TaxID=1839 RepID=A0A543AD64_9ACTN|nr:AlpA family transcriptional regulator [Nocardioides albertanoniae]
MVEVPRAVSATRGRLGALGCMDTNHNAHDNPDAYDAHAATAPFGDVLTLSELCAHLHVPIQTLYDLRSQGRGPRGFRVGRELRFRAGEIEAWLASLEEEDAQRHRPDAEAG